MPRTRRAKPLYQRGGFALYLRAGRHHEIVWYDPTRKRERSASAGTSELAAGRVAVDRLYLATHGGGSTCPTCGQSTDDGNQLVASIIADYLVGHGANRTSAQAIRARLAHVVNYIGTLEASNVRARDVDEAWITRFRRWLHDEPFVAGMALKVRSPATIENSVVQLAAAINWARESVRFRPIPLKDLTNSPSYRADVATLAAMFAYA
nr:phage integrase SAM-like domain-containing protein [Actinomycetota bacterium]